MVPVGLLPVLVGVAWLCDWLFVCDGFPKYLPLHKFCLMLARFPMASRERWVAAFAERLVLVCVIGFCFAAEAGLWVAVPSGAVWVCCCRCGMSNGGLGGMIACACSKANLVRELPLKWSCACHAGKIFCAMFLERATRVSASLRIVPYL